MQMTKIIAKAFNEIIVPAYIRLQKCARILLNSYKWEIYAVKLHYICFSNIYINMFLKINKFIWTCKWAMLEMHKMSFNDLEGLFSNIKINIDNPSMYY